MDVPGYRLHPLRGKQKGRWSISVRQHNYDLWQARKIADLSDVQKVDFEAA
jgi:hypothetical protein